MMSDRLRDSACRVRLKLSYCTVLLKFKHSVWRENHQMFWSNSQILSWDYLRLTLEFCENVIQTTFKPPVLYCGWFNFTGNRAEGKTGPGFDYNSIMEQLYNYFSVRIFLWSVQTGHIGTQQIPVCNFVPKSSEILSQSLTIYWVFVGVWYSVTSPFGRPVI